jgi:uncharacterized protein YaiE (UPF0345 family)
MTPTSMYVVLLCCLMFSDKGLGFHTKRKLYEDAIDNLDNQKREVITKQEFMQNMYNSTPVYTKDNWNVYFVGQKVDGATASSFKSLGSGYGKDSWDVYFMGKKMAGPSASKFEVLGDGYAKDSWDIYFMDQKLSGTTASAFKSIGNGYGKDNWDVYYMGKKIPGATASSFSLIQQGK